MPSMWPHFVNLLSQSGQTFLAALGTTGLGWWVQGIIWFFATEAATYFGVWVFRGKAQMKSRLAENFLIGIFAWMAVTVCVYGPLFGWHIVKAVYDDHNALIVKIKKSENILPIPTWQQPASVRGGPFGPIFAVELVQLFSGLPTCRVRVVVPSDKEEFRGSLIWILQYGAHCTVENSQTPPSLDKPSDPKPRSTPGVTIRWNKNYTSGEKIAHFLDASGLRVDISNEVPSTAPMDLTWIDIGPGDPWK